MKASVDPRRVAVVATVLLLLAVPLPGQEGATAPSRDRTPVEAAAEFLTAYRAGDESAMALVAEGRATDPLMVANALVCMHIDRTSRKVPSEPADYLEALRCLARMSAENPAAAGLAALIDRWCAYDTADLERAARLLEVRRRLEEPMAKRQYDQVDAAVRAAEEDLKEAAHSVNGFLIRTWAVRSLLDRRKIDLALKTAREAVRAAGNLGCPIGEARALNLLAEAEHLRGQADRVLSISRELERIHDAIGDVRGRAYARLHVGNSLRRMARFDEAEEIYRSLLADGAGGDRAILAGATRFLGVTRWRQGRYAEALDFLATAKKMFEDLNEPAEVTSILIDRGSVFMNQGRLKEAITVLEAARVRAEKSGERGAVAVAAGNLGLVLASLGRQEEALEKLLEAHRAKRALGDRRGAAVTLMGVAAARRGLGQYAEAIETLEEAIAVFEACHARALTATALQNLGAVLADMGKFETALDHYERALELKNEAGARASAALTLRNMGGALFNLRRFEEARSRTERALAIFTELEDALGEAACQGLLGSILIELGDLEGAQAYLRQALSTHRRLGNDIGVVESLKSLSYVCQHRGEYERALRCVEKALEICRSFGGHVWLLPELEDQLACIHVNLGNYVRAVSLARSAAEAKLELGHGLGQREAMGLRALTRRPADAGLLALLTHVEEGRPLTAELLGEAFWFVEAGRALLLAESLENRQRFLKAKLPRELYESETRARARVKQLQERLITIAAGRARGPTDPAAVARELDAANRTLDEAIARTQREARRVADVVHPRPIDLGSFQETLSPTDLFVAYQIIEQKHGMKRALALLVTKDHLDIRELGPIEAIRARACEYLDVAGVAEGDEAGLADELYGLLLGPLEAALADKTRLIISPDEVLAFLPFEALLCTEEGKRRRVIERWDVAYVPSATVWCSLHEDAARENRGSGVLILGDPIYPGESPGDREKNDLTPDAALRGLGRLPRLVGSGEEARAIHELYAGEPRRLLLRESATIAGLEKALNEMKGPLAAVHFACHGHLDRTRPWLSGLVMTNGEILTLDDVYRLALPADVVTLSACETGRGEVKRGEGVIGLVRGFFFAGCPRIVVSDWRVSDRSTREFMVAFYRNMREKHLPPAVALRRTKLAFLESTDHAHPYHWAPFVLWGLAE